MKLIVAVDEKWGIGKDGDLLKSIPDDMRFFREKTRSAVLVMGYNTLLSFPGSKPLPGRLNIVLADVEGLRIPGAVVCGSMSGLFELLKTFDSDEVYVIGGGSMYRQLLPYCDTAYITKMRFDGGADTFIPDIDELSEWSVSSESELKECEGIEYSFVEYYNSSVEPFPDGQGFGGRDKGIPELFRRYKELSFDLIDCDDSDYRAEAAAILRAVFEPLKDGMTAADTEAFISGGASFGDHLTSSRLAAAPDEIAALNSRFGSDADTYRVCVGRGDLDTFITRLESGESISDIQADYICAD